MGIITGLLKIAAVGGAAVYFIGRQGLRRAARVAGETVGSSVTRARLSRSQWQRKLVEEQTVEQREVRCSPSVRLLGTVRLHPVLNCFALMLHAGGIRVAAEPVEIAHHHERGGNGPELQPTTVASRQFWVYGHGDAFCIGCVVKACVVRLVEWLAIPFIKPRLHEKALAGTSPSQSAGTAEQQEAYMERQLEMEGQAISNPQMFPFAGRHGATSDTRLVDPAAQGSAAAAQAQAQASPATSGAAGASAESVHELEPELRHLHWSAWDGDSGEEGVIQYSSGTTVRTVRTGVVLHPQEKDPEGDASTAQEKSRNKHKTVDDEPKPER